jgi:tetratricopeptide (TPR) repeat protein
MRIYVCFLEETFVFSCGDVDSLVPLMLEEVASRFKVPLGELVAFIKDDEGRKHPLTKHRIEDKSLIVVERAALDDGDAGMLKETGNALLAKGKFKDAAAKYSKAIAVASTPLLLNALYLNRSLAYLKQSFWKLAEEDAVNVLARDPQNVKARYRQGQALFGAGQVCKKKKKRMLGGCLFLLIVVFRLEQLTRFFLKRWIWSRFKRSRQLILESLLKNARVWERD